MGQIQRTPLHNARYRLSYERAMLQRMEERYAADLAARRRSIAHHEAELARLEGWEEIWDAIEEFDVVSGRSL